MRRLPAFVLVLLLHALAGPARAGIIEARLTTAAGYDEDVLGRPGDPRNFASIGDEGFFQVSPSVEGRTGTGPWQFGGRYTWLYNRYGSDQAGSYQDHLGWFSARYQGPGRLGARVDGSAEVFRRTEYTYDDLDRLHGALQADLVFSSVWTATGGVFLDRERFPDRAVGTGEQVDNGSELEGSLTRSFGIGKRIGAFVVRLDTDSNEPTARHDGWAGGLSGSWTFTGVLDLGLRFSLEERNYDVDPTGTTTREDWYSLSSLDLGKRVNPRLRSFLRLSYTDYHSTAPGYSYSETGGSAGLEFRFGSWGRDVAPRVSPAPADDLAPAIRGRSVRFRHRSQGAAKVALAGSFNGWARDTHLMADPDGDGVWEITVELPPGLHRYMFLVDARSWEKPAGAPMYEDDGFGQVNGVLQIE